MAWPLATARLAAAGLLALASSFAAASGLAGFGLAAPSSPRSRSISSRSATWSPRPSARGARARPASPSPWTWGRSPAWRRRRMGSAWPRPSGPDARAGSSSATTPRAPDVEHRVFLSAGGLSVADLSPAGLSVGGLSVSGLSIAGLSGTTGIGVAEGAGVIDGRVDEAVRDIGGGFIQSRTYGTATAPIDAEHDHHENDAKPRRGENRTRRNILVELLLRPRSDRRARGSPAPRCRTGFVMRVIVACWLGFPYAMRSARARKAGPRTAPRRRSGCRCCRS